MSEKNPNAERWGGPGASQEDATEPKPKKGPDRRAPGPTNDRKSHVSGGGGERDLHHTHDPKEKK